jgi:hypothetical protein
VAVVLTLAAALLLTACGAPAPTYDTEVLDGLRTDADDMAAIATCLEQRGWDASLIEGAIEIDVPTAQQEQYEKDSTDCLREVGIDPDAPLTEEQYRAVYDWSLEVARCLEGAGFAVPVAPSYEVFRSTYDSDPWIPWSLVEGSDLGRAGAACPVLDAGS